METSLQGKVQLWLDFRSNCFTPFISCENNFTDWLIIQLSFKLYLFKQKIKQKIDKSKLIVNFNWRMFEKATNNIVINESFCLQFCFVIEYVKLWFFIAQVQRQNENLYKIVFFTLKTNIFTRVDTLNHRKRHFSTRML